jgi:hypothetical protein
MRFYSRPLLILAVLLLHQSPSFAGGSITIDDLRPILDQQPKLWEFFQTQFDISQHGVGLRLGKDWGELEGTRIAPYEFEAKMRGDPGPYNLKLIIETNGWYYDLSGKQVSDPKKAFRIKEVLTNIGVGPLHPAELK